MTNRRLSEQERSIRKTRKEYQEERRKIISLCSPEYMADAHFLFASRIQTTSMLSRIDLFRPCTHKSREAQATFCRRHHQTANGNEKPTATAIISSKRWSG